MRTHGSRRACARALVALVAAASLTGCGVPIPPELPDTTPSRTPPAEGEVDRLVPVDVRTEELTGALRALAARIAEASDLLLAEEDAVGVLLGTEDGDDAPGVLPAIEPDRGGTASDDLVTALVTLASDVGGERGRIVLELVRDPMLGDLGAWQRDPVGVITLLRAIADDVEDRSRDATSLDAALLELPGELTRAVGYALVVARTEDTDLRAHASRQGAGRLGVVLIALELAVERLEGTS